MAAPGTSEFLKTWSPQSGDIVSFRHSGFLEGTKKPKFPLLYRLRPELTWDHVCSHWKDVSSSSSLKENPIRRPKTRHRKKGYWRDSENERKVLINFAKDMGFDPLDPGSWTPTMLSQLAKNKDARMLINKYGTLRAVLLATIPELQNANFAEGRRPNHYWKDIGNVRKFFLALAADRGIDPLSVDSWYAVPQRDVAKKSGGWSILEEHKGYRSALRLAFPELDFDRWQ